MAWLGTRLTECETMLPDLARHVYSMTLHIVSCISQEVDCRNFKYIRAENLSCFNQNSVYTNCFPVMFDLKVWSEIWMHMWILGFILGGSFTSKKHIEYFLLTLHKCILKGRRKNVHPALLFWHHFCQVFVYLHRHNAHRSTSHEILLENHSL